MDKKLLITLINKDLDELKVLTKGFSEMNGFSQTLVNLAVEKAKNIADYLQKLPLTVADEQAATTKNQEVIQPQMSYFSEKTENNTTAETPLTPKQERENGYNMWKNFTPKENVEVKISDEQPQIEEQIEIIEEQPEIIVKQTENVEKTVVETVSHNAVLDLKQVLSIADRFRFQRELFNGNGEKFSQSLTDFNKMQTLEEAQNYIVKNLKIDLENPVVQDFIKILRKKLN